MDPVRLRPVTDKSIGTTAFFRNRALLDAVCQELSSSDQQEIKVLFHACSIGAEVYSFLVYTLLDSRLKDKMFKVEALDLEQGFVNFANQAIYPKQILSSMSKAEQKFFDIIGDNVRPTEEIRNKVSFLKAGSFCDFEAEAEYDLVFLLNAFIYVPDTVQSDTIDRIAKYNRGLFVTTAFHQDSIKQDLSRNGYTPLLDNIIAIHDGWSDRRKPETSRGEIVPGKIYHPWSLPPFEKVDEYEYKYCAIFRKN